MRLERCQSLKRDYAAFLALSRLMQQEVSKTHLEGSRTAGMCACCGHALKTAYRVVRDSDGRVFEVESGSQKAKGIESGEIRIDSSKFSTFEIYYCDILLDSWHWDEAEKRRISPVDGAFRLIEIAKREALNAAGAGRSTPAKSGLDKLGG